MDDLSLLLASRELFLSLYSQKVKTLKQAFQMNKKGLQNQKIDDLMVQYENQRQKVAHCIDDSSKQWVNYQSPKFQDNPLRYYLQSPSVIEIIGQKGSGKTGFLLKLGLDYVKMNKQRRIKIFNCAGGITAPRISRFKSLNYEYSDIFLIDNLIQNLQNIKKEQNYGLILIDSPINLFLSNQKVKFGLGELILSLRDKGWSIYFTNYIQGKFQVDEKQLLNPNGYFSHVLGGLCDCKWLMQASQEKDNYFKMRMIKSLNDRNYEYKALMTEYGLDDLILQKS